MAYQPLPQEDLRIGLYIKILGNWFSHPFPSPKFKIKTQKEIETLRSLKNYKIQYDPARSDPLPPVKNETESVEDQEAPPDPQSTPISDNLFDDVSLLISGEDPHQISVRWREKLKETEYQYNEVLQQNKASIREVRAGYAKGIAKAENLVTTLGDILDQNGILVSLMNFTRADEEADNDFYYHSLNVCMLSMVLGQGLDLPQEQIMMLGIGALFHDIGELDGAGMFIPKGSKLTKEEQLLHLQHPSNGRKMLEKGLFGIPEASLAAIGQHHERLNGTGFPNGVKEDSFHLLSKIVMVADAYDELCNNPHLEKSLTPHEAIAKLYARRQTEFWEEAIVALVHNLGVYPPSSIVELSDDSIGMVTSINLLDRMKPTMMLYDPDIPREEAIMVDLSQDGGRTIKRALRPVDIPKGIWKYLNPRGVISYFAYIPDPIPTMATPKSPAPQDVLTRA